MSVVNEENESTLRPVVEEARGRGAQQRETVMDDGDFRTLQRRKEGRERSQRQRRARPGGNNSLRRHSEALGNGEEFDREPAFSYARLAGNDDSVSLIETN
jgi:hypothetical protein